MKNNLLDKEVKVPSVELKTTSNEKVKKTYQLANLTKVFFARIFDLLIISAATFLVTFFLKNNLGNWSAVFTNFGISLGIILIYFVFLPILMHGNTFGKLIFNLRLKTSRNNQKIRWYMILTRELYFWLIPWIVGISANVIAILILNTHVNDDSFHYDAYLIYNLGYVFFALWFIFLGISIKIQKDHQAGIDMKFDLFVVDKNPKVESNLKSQEKSLTSDEHIVLTTMPANFDEEKLKDLVVNSETEFNQSINLTDLKTDKLNQQISPTQQKIMNKKKKEHKDDKF